MRSGPQWLARRAFTLQLHISLDPLGVDFSFDKIGMKQNRFLKWCRRFDSLDPQLIEAANHAIDRLLARRLVDNQFANHRIVERRNGVASVNVRIESATYIHPVP